MHSFFYIFTMRGSRKFCQRRSNFDNVFCLFWGAFLVDEEREDPNTTISGQSSAHKRTPLVCVSINLHFQRKPLMNLRLCNRS